MSVHVSAGARRIAGATGIVATVFVVVFGASRPAAAPVPNAIEIVIVGGPHAGTYRPPQETIICADSQARQFAASYKDFDEHDPRKVSEAGIRIANPTDAGTKRGEALVSFGAPDRQPGFQYDIWVPRDSPGPLIFTRTGKTAELRFQGRARDGATVTIVARCTDIDPL